MLSGSANARKYAGKTAGRFGRRYLLPVLVLVLALVAFGLAVYAAFVTEGPFAVGDDLRKSDWLSFIGAYLAFCGSLFVGLVALLQNRWFREDSQNDRLEDRRKQIRPVVKVAIVSVDKAIPVPVSAGMHASGRVSNTCIRITNIGCFPITNVILFDSYQSEALLPDEGLTIWVSYEELPDALRSNGRVVRVLPGDYERSDEGIPTWFNLCFDDVDGNSGFQTFELMDFDGAHYYSLESTEYA